MNQQQQHVRLRTCPWCVYEAFVKMQGGMSTMVAKEKTEKLHMPHLRSMKTRRVKASPYHQSPPFPVCVCVFIIDILGICVSFDFFSSICVLLIRLIAQAEKASFGCSWV